MKQLSRVRAWVLASVALLLPTSALPQLQSRAPGVECLGHWTGTGQNGGTPPWSIEMTVSATSGPVCGTIEYPSLGCGGTLTNCVSRSGQLTAVEQYSHTSRECSPDGTIVARCANGRMQWVWVGDEVVRTSLTRNPP